jgi:hypothetical protein
MHAGLQMQPAAAPPSASYQQQQQPQNEFGLTAQPGESDEAFALRLAAMYGSSPGGSSTVSPSLSTTASSAANSNAPSRLGSTTAPTRPQQQQQQQQPDHSNPFTQAAAVPTASGNPFTAHGTSSSDTQQQQLGPMRLSDGDVPSAPPAAAAPAAAVLGPASDAADSYVGGSDAELCVICLSAPREVGLLHGASVHKCLCKECAPMVRVGTPCPMCRQNVERILGVY